MKKKVIILIIIIFIAICVILKINKTSKVQIDENVVSSSESAETKKYTKAEIACVDGTTDETMYLDSIEIEDENMDKIVAEIFDAIEENNQYDFEYAGDYFEGAPILTIYLENGDIMQATALDQWESDNGQINIIKVAYEEDWSDAVMYIIDSEKATEMNQLYYKYANENIEANFDDAEYQELKDIAIEYRDSRKIQNYKDFEYDLDGDGTTEKVTIKRTVDGDDRDVYLFELNDEVFEENEWYPTIYITDLNENDNYKEVIIYDDGSSDDPTIKIYTLQNNKLEKQIQFDTGTNVKSDKNGNFFIVDEFEDSVTPDMRLHAYTIEDGIINNADGTEFTRVENREFYVKYDNDILFTDNTDNFEKAMILESDETFDEAIEKAGVEYLDKNTLFKVLDYPQNGNIEVELNDGRTGFIVNMNYFTD